MSADRRNQDKPETGQIHLQVSQQGSELLVEFGDDGRGLDREILAGRAVELGLALNTESVSDDHLLQVICESGFSTADEVTMVSGRGVGMDVVLQAVRSLGGSMSLRSKPGQGTSFNFRLPVTMIISQALLVRVGAYRFAILTRSVERVLRVRHEEIQVIDDRDHVAVDDQVLPIVNLADRLGEQSLSTAETYRSIMLMRMTDTVAAFEVDQFEETVEVVIKTPGSQLTSIVGITGVTVLADTSIVLILNPGEFLDRESLSVIPAQAQLPAGVVDIGESADMTDIDITAILQNVLVVDDSLVVRKVMQRDIESIGLTVTTAVDGVNALQLLEDRNIDVALIDLEMPKMNGYELIVRLRQDVRYANLPIIVVTSRSGDMHRTRAINLGADAYITKPYNIQDLEQMMKTAVRDKVTIH
jgi:chemosensory pili system protein ChpA (sensor histidine kinase/response regulator)